MAQKVELRKRSGGGFGSGNDNLMLPVTHVKFVLGLLDEDNNKLKIELLPDSMLNTKRMAGTINDDTNFGNVYNMIIDFNDNKKSMYPGTYFISNGKNLISASTDHLIYYNDDSLNAASTVELEHGDHLFYVKEGSERAWELTGVELNVTPEAGITALEAPYNTISSSHIFATEAELAAFNAASPGQKALVTGFKWIPSTITEYNAAGYGLNKTATLGGTPRESDANHAAIPTYELWEYRQHSVVLKLEDAGAGSSYWKLVQIDASIQGDPKVYESVSYADKHIWGVINNSYGLATTTAAGLMSSVDKTKLNSLLNYVHPSNYGAQLVETSGVEVITGFESDTFGHVKSVSKRPIPSASVDGVGVVELATAAEGREGTDDDRALTPASGLAMLKHRQDVSFFGSVELANTAGLPDGAIAIIEKEIITIP